MKWCKSLINTPAGIQVMCRKCANCRNYIVNERLGRAIAESRTALTTQIITLTYRTEGSGDRPDRIHKGDIDLFIKRIRKKYGRLRYIATAERGELKGRVHWHVILYFYERIPKFELRKRQHWKQWPWGHVYVDIPDANAIRYALKYSIKSTQYGDTNSFAFLKSTHPPLGSEYFINLARKSAMAGIKPNSWHYTFPDVLDRLGKKRKFYLIRKSRDIFMDAYKNAYIEKWGKFPHNALIDEYYEDKPDDVLEFIGTYKPVMYFTPWKDFEDTEASKWLKTEMITGKYQGIPVIVIDNDIFYGDQTWHANQKTVQSVVAQLDDRSSTTFGEEFRKRQHDLEFGNSKPPQRKEHQSHLWLN
jgi:hypothetical protein